MNILRTKGENWRMATLNKWIVIAAALIIGLFAGVVLNEAFDVFGAFGLGSQRTAIRAERERDKAVYAAGIDLLKKSFALREQGDAADKAKLERRLEAKQGRLEEYAERDRIFGAGEEATGRAAKQIAEGLRAVDRLEALVGQLK